MAKDNPAKPQDLPNNEANGTDLDEATLDSVNGGFISSIIKSALESKAGSFKPAGYLGDAQGNAVKSIGEGLSQTTRN